jgi:hypothetical protein
MSQNTQNPYFYTLDGDVGDNLRVVGATYISIYSDANNANTTIVLNEITGQEMAIPSGCVMELSPASGCTLQTLLIYPSGDNLAYVTMLGGTAILV